MWSMLKNKKASPEKATILRKAAALCMVFAMFAAGCSQKQETSGDFKEGFLTPEKTNYKTVKVEMGGYERVRTGTATVVFPLQFKLSWEEDGTYYQEAAVTVGQAVKEGDPLVYFRREEDQIALETLKLQLKRKQESHAAEEARRLAAIADAQEKRNTLKEQGATAYELEKARLNGEKLQVEYEQFLYTSGKELARLEEQLTEMERSAQRNVLFAPHDGVIDSVIKIQTGDKVTRGQVLVTMHATDKVLLKAQNASENLRYNTNVIIRIGNIENPSIYTGKVIVAANILPTGVSQDMTLIEVDQEIAEKDMKKIIKFEGTVEALSNVLVVDQRAVQREEGKYYVRILDGDTVQKRYVAAVKVNTEKMWILDGLCEGQLLIVD